VRADVARDRTPSIIALSGREHATSARAQTVQKPSIYAISGLTSPEAIAEFIADALETGDAPYIAKAIGAAVRAELNNTPQ
jgi:hypothetical protein